MTLTIFMWIFTGASAASAIGILLTKNIFRAALLLLCCLLSLAALFFLLSAEMLGVTQVLIYAGGIVVLILFGIMLTVRGSLSGLKVENANIFSGLLMGIFTLSILIKVFRGWVFPNSVGFRDNSLKATGVHIMTDFLLPFELTGILLLVALVGAIVLSTNLTSRR